jgi:adenylate cyclase
MPDRPLGELLICDRGGWSLSSVTEWLLDLGNRAGTALHFMEGLTERLTATGWPVSRFRLAVETLNAQIATWAVAWEESKPVESWDGAHGIHLTSAYIGSPAQTVMEHGTSVRYRVDGPPGPDEHSFYHDLHRDGLTDYFALPVVFGNGQLNLASFATRRPGGFAKDDLDKFHALCHLVAPILDAINGRRVAASLMDTYIGRRTGPKILDGLIRRGDGEIIQAALWYSDLRNFTRLSERLSTNDLIDLLNSYFESLTAAAEARGGEVLQYIGDAVLIVFAAEKDDQVKQACHNAVEAAIDAFSAVAVTNSRRRRQQLPEIEFGLGLHVGRVTHANVGSQQRLAFNVIGPAVNRTARIEAKTKDYDTPLLLSHEIASRIPHKTRLVDKTELRGIAGMHGLYTLDPVPVL